MGLSASGRTWDDATSPAATRLARRYESAWRGANGDRPDPLDYLPSDPRERPGALLALLRIDLALRWEASDRVRVEFYRDRHPELGSEALVALIYEEFCLREEAGESPSAAEYLERFPECASQLLRVLEIHGLMGSTRSTTFPWPSSSTAPFPDVGQTIGGFHLVEELGRGAFARVFRAEERQLADRPVALKVARTGSREPQTLARLQHTNIVPVYSYRIDPVSGLHLLCMPYFGRVTLAQIMADPTARSARSGAGLVAALDRLEPAESIASGRPTGRLALARRSHAQAIAWWGARLAEALQHAHDRGVLHRDIKPSNVLVTSDGMPMLLDFNLAQEAWIDDPDVAPATLGGTLAYMAPEHLEALADGLLDGVDCRADIYALGVVLFEALGTRPFSQLAGALTINEALLRGAEERRIRVPSLRESHSEVPPALDAVVRRCLEPEAANRYSSAAELAADLQAVADDGPLRFAREPQPSRSLRWLRRNRRRLLVAAPIVFALTVAALALNKAQIDRLHQEMQIQQWIADAKLARETGEFDKAMIKCDSASQLANRYGFQELYHQARQQWYLASQTKQNRADADQLFHDAEPLRFCLLGFGGDLQSASDKLKQELGVFFVLANPNWTKLEKLTKPLLDDDRRERLINEVNELLFMWVVAADREGDQETAQRALPICERALVFAEPKGPWQALRARFAARLGLAASGPSVASNPAAESSARACFQWALLSDLEHRRDWAIAWLERACRLEPNHYWYQFTLAWHHAKSNHVDQALEHYSEAITIDPASPWARHNRAGLYRIRGAWAEALDDLQRALQTANDFDLVKARLDLGLVHQALGDTHAARADYEEVIRLGPDTPYARAARLNRAKLDVDAGALDRARAEYDRLIASDPDDAPARLGRALLALRAGRPNEAEADLSRVLADPNEDSLEQERSSLRARAFTHRALARLALGRAMEAEADAESAFLLDASPSHERLWNRTLVAAGRETDLRIDTPDDVALWPASGRALVADLRAAADRLRAQKASDGESSPRRCLTRAILLSMLADPAAEEEASRAVTLDPLSAHVRMIRASVRIRAGDALGATADVERGLSLDPTSPRLLELRGVLQAEAGHHEAALADFDGAIRLGAKGRIRRSRAETLIALGRTEQAVDDWSRALAYDAEDPRCYLGRARAFLRLRQTDQALADLEQAAGWNGGRTDLLLPITLTYAVCLRERPDRLPHMLNLVRRFME
jgi:eukaryotic-like serine/threonine-protein kinase